MRELPHFFMICLERRDLLRQESGNIDKSVWYKRRDAEMPFAAGRHFKVVNCLY